MLKITLTLIDNLVKTSKLTQDRLTRMCPLYLRNSRH